MSLRIPSGRWSSCGIPSGKSDVHDGLRLGSKIASLYLMTQDSKQPRHCISQPESSTTKEESLKRHVLFRQDLLVFTDYTNLEHS